MRIAISKEGGYVHYRSLKQAAKVYDENATLCTAETKTYASMKSHRQNVHKRPHSNCSQCGNDDDVSASHGNHLKTYHREHIQPAMPSRGDNKR